MAKKNIDQSTSVNISSNTLFHFTNSLEKLEGILKNNFLPHYCYEDIIQKALPMVCFCDLPFFQLKDHIATYKFYGIGLEKKWGILNRLNPVIYLSGHSFLEFQVIHLLRDFSPTLDVAKDAIDYIHGYIKPYKGDFKKNGILHKDYNFYHEREWRFIPLKDYDNSQYFLNKSEYDDHEERERANKFFTNCSLKFKPEDIKYLIIKDDSQISELVKIIKNTKYPYHLDTVVDRLTTKIITTKKIYEDM